MVVRENENIFKRHSFQGQILFPMCVSSSPGEKLFWFNGWCVFWDKIVNLLPKIKKNVKMMQMKFKFAYEFCIRKWINTTLCPEKRQKVLKVNFHSKRINKVSNLLKTINYYGNIFCKFSFYSAQNHSHSRSSFTLI